MEHAIVHLRDLKKSIQETIDFQKKNLASSKKNCNNSNQNVFQLFCDMYTSFIKDAFQNVNAALIPIEQIYIIINGHSNKNRK